jgi:hypothetical protein
MPGFDLFPDDFRDLRDSPHSVRLVSDDDRMPLDERNVAFLAEFQAAVKDSQAKRESRKPRKRQSKPMSRRCFLGYMANRPSTPFP